jgi:pimeloyl-ACP methyl ester carboxylesterase
LARCCWPWPASHKSRTAFAPIWAPLAEHARLFAVDLPGFGASERRTDLLSPRAMGQFLVRLIAEADLGTPHIVAPDVGTAAALFAAAAHPERIASAIVGTGGAAVPIATSSVRCQAKTATCCPRNQGARRVAVSRSCGADPGI